MSADGGKFIQQRPVVGLELFPLSEHAFEAARVARENRSMVHQRQQFANLAQDFFDMIPMPQPACFPMRRCAALFAIIPRLAHACEQIGSQLAKSRDIRAEPLLKPGRYVGRIFINHEEILNCSGSAQNGVRTYLVPTH